VIGLDPLWAALHAAGIDAFSRPLWLWLGLAAALVALGLAARKRSAAVGWPAGHEARSAGARRVDVVGAVALLLRAGALVALAGVLAGPVGVRRAAPEPGLGLDLALVLDASGSMRALDARVDGEWRTRLDLAREVVARFARRRAAKGDRVALVVFGESAFTQCPLTGDGALLGDALGRVEAGMAGEATALGDALGLAIKRVRSARARRPAASTAGAGQVVVLLTDGRHNAGALSLEMAAALASAAGVRVHTVAIGTAGEEVAMAAPASPGAPRGPRFERHDVDEASLQRIARTSGGRFFSARRSSDLDAVYAEIDSLERVERRLPARLRHSERPEPLLALAGGLLLTEIAVARVGRRRLP
jgi:Ca-activated chloride channel family protein